MTTPTTSIDVSTLIIGPCTSFLIDGVDVGGTSNGVQIEKKQKLNPITVDQIPGEVAQAIEDESYSIKTELPAVTLANLQLAWGLSQAPVTTAGPPATQTLSLGIERKVIEHTLSFTGPAPGGKTRTYTNARAVAMVSGAATLDKKKQMTYPVEFKILPDLTDVGAEYGTIVDQ
jgi:hypothetical protein